LQTNCSLEGEDSPLPPHPPPRSRLSLGANLLGSPEFQLRSWHSCPCMQPRGLRQPSLFPGTYLAKKHRETNTPGIPGWMLCHRMDAAPRDEGRSGLGRRVWNPTQCHHNLLVCTKQSAEEEGRLPRLGTLSRSSNKVFHAAEKPTKPRTSGHDSHERILSRGKGWAPGGTGKGPAGC